MERRESSGEEGRCWKSVIRRKQGRAKEGMEDQEEVLESKAGGAAGQTSSYQKIELKEATLIPVCVPRISAVV